MSDQVVIPASHGPREILPAEHFAANPWADMALGGAKPSDIAEAFERLTAEQREAAQRAALKIYEDPTLRPFLEYLTDITLRRPVVLGIGKEAMALAHQREGANRVVWLAYQMIAMARGEMPPYREGM